MTTSLVVHDVGDDIASALRDLAALHGHTAEEELKEILKKALLRPRRRSVVEVLSSMPNVGRDEDFDRRPVKE